MYMKREEHECSCLWKSEEGVRATGTVVKLVMDLQNRFWGLSLGSQKKQQVLLTPTSLPDLHEKIREQNRIHNSNYNWLFAYPTTTTLTSGGLSQAQTLVCSLKSSDTHGPSADRLCLQRYFRWEAWCLCQCALCWTWGVPGLSSEQN